MADPPVYSIGALARILGIPAATLRTWEDRYDVVVPERSPGGQRLYSQLQLEQLRFVGDQVSAGLSTGDAHRLLQERVVGGAPLGRAEIPDGSGLIILLAERDPYAADFSEYFLRRAGYVVVVVTTVEQAVAETARKTPDLAVIDLLISGGNGLQLVAHLRERLDVPVLAISTLELRDDALAAGASTFLRKPLQPLQLVSVIKRMLGQRPLVRADSDR
jgi:CheY-like chemotaxis protein